MQAPVFLSGEHELKLYTTSDRLFETLCLFELYSYFKLHVSALLLDTIHEIQKFSLFFFFSNPIPHSSVDKLSHHSLLIYCFSDNNSVHLVFLTTRTLSPVYSFTAVNFMTNYTSISKQNKYFRGKIRLTSS